MAERLGSAPTGPIRLLTHLRSFGHCFNPVSFYYCFAPGGERLEAIVAEVTNTPWGERHAYVLPRGDDDGEVLGGGFDKRLHVSPFMGMDQRYTWKAPAPGATLSVHIESSEDGRRAFDATLGLRRRPFTRRVLADVTARYPAATLRMLALIYGHAIALKLKGVPVQPHPQGQLLMTQRHRPTDRAQAPDAHQRRSARPCSRATSASCSAPAPRRRRCTSTTAPSGPR